MPVVGKIARKSRRWVLDHEEVSVMITGASRSDQARDNASGSGLPPLGHALHERLAGFHRAEVEHRIRGPY